MINRFKFFLPIIFVAILGLAPTYALANVTYYTLVTHKPLDGQWDLAKPIEPSDLAVGFYRFQIVRLSQTESPTWIALRGEFEFVADPYASGVKLKEREALDESQRFDNQPNVNLSLWSSNNRRSWKQARKQWVRPLFAKMKNTFKGAFEPNLIRFLLQKGVEESWNVEKTWNQESKNYSLYRLHYLDADTISNRYKKAFSRFINPSVEATTDVELLKQWVDSQESFSLAKYHGIPDKKHQEFYKQFQTWFNLLFPEQLFQEPNLEDKPVEKHPQENGSWEVLYVLLGIIIALFIIGAWLFAQAYRIHQRENNTESYFSIIVRLIGEKWHHLRQKTESYFSTVVRFVGEKWRNFRQSGDDKQDSSKPSKLKFFKQGSENAPDYENRIENYFSTNMQLVGKKWRNFRHNLYVSRSEFDSLKGEFDSLRVQVRKLSDIEEKQRIQVAEGVTQSVTEGKLPKE
ncbi:hypothetical protein QUF54_04070 [Candidatus Marithioploca araucensis]|uniref:DUF4129 domain-containing protein n=1 Tax=Candidatus Marithioploca araucensis TaxID=70273 RepID=A0ABT7VS67_9GAMM|nr:hypothetical protein [Candidatus Marithioploca araucensis]